MGVSLLDTYRIWREVNRTREEWEKPWWIDHYPMSLDAFRTKKVRNRVLAGAVVTSLRYRVRLEELALESEELAKSSNELLALRREVAELREANRKLGRVGRPW